MIAQQPSDAITNLDGTLTVNDGAYGRYGAKVAKIDISGKAIASYVGSARCQWLDHGLGGCSGRKLSGRIG